MEALKRLMREKVLTVESGLARSYRMIILWLESIFVHRTQSEKRTINFGRDPLK
jgi:hypothetical protein